MKVLIIAIMFILSGCAGWADIQAEMKAQAAYDEAFKDWRPYKNTASRYIGCAPEEIEVYNSGWGPNGEIFYAKCEGHVYKCRTGGPCQGL